LHIFAVIFRYYFRQLSLPFTRYAFRFFFAIIIDYAAIVLRRHYADFRFSRQFSCFQMLSPFRRDEPAITFSPPDTAFREDATLLADAPA